jgi:lipid-binding SYLF domain-containing protein
MSTFYKAVAALLVTMAGATALAQHPDHDSGPKVSESERAERRTEIMQMSKDTLANLKKEDATANDLLSRAYGTAVFDTTKGGLIVTGAGGTGVAMHKNGAQPVYMHMGEGGVGLGAGIEKFKLVLLFENKETYDKFVEGAWSASASAQAAAGRNGAGQVAKFNNGVAVYQVSDKGVIAQVDFTGVKFWPSDRLNEGPA